MEDIGCGATCGVGDCWQVYDAVDAFYLLAQGIVVGDTAATELGAVYFEVFIKADDSDAVASAY